MQTRTTRAIVSFLVLSIGALPLHAQSPILLRLRNAESSDRLVVDSAGGLLVRGGAGTIPATGGGVRLMWYPAKWAFRAGMVNSTIWDDAYVGVGSVAFGTGTRATGAGSVAMGNGTTALGANSFAVGLASTTFGASAFAAGGGTSVALGSKVHASAEATVAIGSNVQASHPGSLIFGDASTPTELVSSAENEFTLRAAGGVRLFTDAATSSGVTLAPGGSAWGVVSDRRRKEAFLPLDGEDMLARIRTLPLSTWRYIAEQDRSTRHIGPMAQDWYAAFGFSRDSLTINSGDLDGVNLAGVQALEARTSAQAEQIRALQAEMTVLRQGQADDRRRLKRLEARRPAGK